MKQRSLSVKNKRPKSKHWLIVAAGGQGKRMGQSVNKIFLPLLNRPVISWTLSVLDQSPSIDHLVITIGREDKGQLEGVLKKEGFKKKVVLVEAGETRQDSTFKALQKICQLDSQDADLVGVHNAANPLVSLEEIEAVFQAAAECGGALLAMKAKDTVKVTDELDLVQETPLRQLVWYAQTPQVGRLDLMEKAFLEAQRLGFQGTDDTQLLERVGVPVKVVSCSTENFKITFPQDLFLAEEIMKKRLSQK